jgi:hypothetical protein
MGGTRSYCGFPISSGVVEHAGNMEAGRSDNMARDRRWSDLRDAEASLTSNIQLPHF